MVKSLFGNTIVHRFSYLSLTMTGKPNLSCIVVIITNYIISRTNISLHFNLF